MEGKAVLGKYLPNPDLEIWLDFVSSIAWPLVALIALVVLASSDSLRAIIERVSSRFRRVSAFGIELELSEKTAVQVKEVTEESFAALRRKIRGEFDRLAHVYAIAERHRRLIEEFASPAIGESLGGKPSFKSTIHVPDILFSQTLYQLLDYYPGGGGRGRSFPTRFGIVGRAWRLNASQIADVPPDPEILVHDWGMTLQEATKTGQGQQAFAGFVVHDECGLRVAVVYLASELPGHFGRDEESQGRLETSVQAGVQATGLAESLRDMNGELRRRGPLIRIYEVGEE